MRTFDLIVIGAGPAGYVGAIRAAQLGMKVAVIDKENLGGTCLNWGCIPTKALLQSSDLYKSSKEGSRYGILTGDVTYDIEKAYSYMGDVKTKLHKGIEGLLKANKVEILSGNASFVDQHRILLGDEELGADRFLIATGSKVAKPLLEGIEHTIDSDTVTSMPVTGENIAIIGGGVIGIEFATHYLNLGKSVTIFEFQDQILSLLDDDICRHVTMHLKKEGAKIKTKTVVVRIDPHENQYNVTYKSKDIETTETFDLVISCVGRKPNTEGLNLEQIGIETLKGAIVINKHQQTNIPTIYAAGDVTNKIQLAHYASAQAIAAVEHMAEEQPSQDLNIVPACIYTTPEVAYVGLTEKECDGDIIVSKYMMAGNGKSIIVGQDKGVIKTIYDKETHRLIGAHMFCAHATEMIGEYALAISNGLTAHEIAKTIHAHPTVSESLLECVEESLGKAIHTLPKRK
ncbi:MAG: dihydrolipoyl dehydrogenase [Bacteroidales bacterium]